jgi:3,4-dihydroxy 2-butanone 4-phosphate synthase/GTP cyclohydrolase II
VDDEDRENEGDLVFAAEMATPELVAFMTRYTSGYICVPMTGEDLDRLEIPLMVGANQERMRTAYTSPSTRAPASPPASPRRTGHAR